MSSAVPAVYRSWERSRREATLSDAAMADEGYLSAGYGLLSTVSKQRATEQGTVHGRTVGECLSDSEEEVAFGHAVGNTRSNGTAQCEVERGGTGPFND